MKRLKKVIFERNNSSTSKKSIILTTFLMITLSISSLLVGNYIATRGIFFVKTSETVKSTASTLNDTSKKSGSLEKWPTPGLGQGKYKISLGLLYQNVRK